MDKRKIDIEIDCPVCSSGDCTGLIPAGINNKDEIEAYNEMYNFIPDPIIEEKENKKPHQK
ncbi:MAG: hypothetical protein E7509_01015 [Ruminococcus sp.]|nr:hypothetical protein [Ruminococcus sp.]